MTSNNLRWLRQSNNGSPARNSSSASPSKTYSVSNRGLRSGLVGTAEQVSERPHEFDKAGNPTSSSSNSAPNSKKMERFASSVIGPQISVGLVLAGKLWELAARITTVVA